MTEDNKRPEEIRELGEKLGTDLTQDTKRLEAWANRLVGLAAISRRRRNRK